MNATSNTSGNATPPLRHTPAGRRSLYWGDPAGDPDDLARQAAAARTDPHAVVLEGVHALKHAVRFGARLRWAVTPDPRAVRDLLTRLAPDVAERLDHAVGLTWLSAALWARLTPRGLPSPVLAVADRPTIDLAAAVTAPGARPVVVLEAPTHLGNVGAVVRVAAAADAAAMVVVGAADPWHPTAVRGGAGLQLALPVARVDTLPPSRRPLVALDPAGEPLDEVALPPGAILAFGGERHGLSDGLLARAQQRVALPMRTGVSSLNLATAVAATLYALDARGAATRS